MARELINGISVPVPGTGEPADFQGELRSFATDLSASYAPIDQPALAEVKAKLGVGRGASLLFLSDSTGNDASEWIHRFAEWLAARYPAQTFRYHLYDFATGTGTVTNGSATISGLTVTGGAFAVGQKISGPFIPAGATVTVVDSSNLTISAPAVIPSGIGSTFAASLTATLDAYAAPEVIQTGNGIDNGGGPFVVDVYNFAVPGANTVHVLGMGTWNTKVVAPNPDAVFLSHGHNDGSGGSVPAATWWDDLAACTESIRLSVPNASLCVVAQNPRTTDNDMTLRRFETIRWCRERGYGFIDVWQAFYDASDELATLAPLLRVDGIHPEGDAATPGTGQHVWLTEFQRHWRSTPGGIEVPSLKTSTFENPRASLLVNGDFATACGRVSLGGSSVTSGSAIVTVSSTTGLYVGAYVTGSLIQADTQIKSIDSSTQITLTRTATGSSASTTITQAQGFPYWTPVNLSADGTNLGVSKDTSNWESLPPLSGGMSPATGWSARLQSLAAGQAYIKQVVPVRLCLGKWVTLTVRVRRSTDYVQRARPRIFQIGGTGAGGNFANALQGFDSQFVYLVAKRFIPVDATALQIEFYATASVSDNGADVSIDRASLVVGQTPADVRRALAA